MSLFSLIVALLFEQFRPLDYRRFVLAPLSALADFLEHHLNGGARQHGVFAWVLAVIAPTLLAGGVFYALYAVSPLLAWLWNVAVLYFTLGFRQFSHFFTDIQLALRMGDLAHAYRLLGEWRGATESDPLPASRDVQPPIPEAGEIARAAIEEALIASHRHVFGVLVCFVLLPGPCGAVLYRCAAFLAEHWGARTGLSGSDEKAEKAEKAGASASLPRAADALTFAEFGVFSTRAFAFIDWLPVRVTAAGFAVVGDFEDAVYCWRTQADRVRDAGIGIVLASGAGALGVRLGSVDGSAAPAASDPPAGATVELGAGDEAEADHMQSAVGLVWRALLLWMLVLLLLGFATLVGN
ncbi:CobD/CbiB family protein [Rhodocyclus tenuis]|uniref:cobalamin biosynthesis protein n=1 Tax=Rhodocyclus gracilis TaxID=2929842 RepID=UPI001298E75D|nr:cobalamin biosynthesis protein [Rhodocyclus gracilis]MRD72498.1 CobD/CbiB family protein [Rhodocyclus gracilis]